MQLLESFYMKFKTLKQFNAEAAVTCIIPKGGALFRIANVHNNAPYYPCR